MNCDLNFMKIVLSKRLKAIANLVEGNVIADIGCDSANLAIWLAKSKGFYIYACDLREGPLKKARFNVEKFEVMHMIKLIQANGLQGVPSSVNEIIIAGLGGELIEKIILNCSWLKNKQIRIILQPQSFAVKLKQRLYKNGFFISRQVYVADRGKAYEVFVARFCGIKRVLSLKDALVGGLSKNDEGSCCWVGLKKQKLLKVLNSLIFAKQTVEVLQKRLGLITQYSILKEWEVG